MRNYVENLESIAQDLPEGKDVTLDDFVSYWDTKLDAIIANGKVTKVTKIK